jgi:hypothetical protein
MDDWKRSVERNQSFQFEIRAIDAIYWSAGWEMRMFEALRAAAQKAGVDPATVVIYQSVEEFGASLRFLVEYACPVKVVSLLPAAMESLHG